ncbi:MAG TPA: DUF488 domain-containing protein [Opitutus sp.]|nr:DUF488 domain-containing protein [Opitutus sp.]
MQNRRVRTGGLFTIGYEGKSLEGYLQELASAGITLLCDVRRNPVSRKKGFAKSALAAACAAAGIRYEHVPQLGIASEERKAVRTAADRAALFERYRWVTLPRETAAVAQIRRWIEEDGARVALTCFERDPCECHRHQLAAVLASEGVAGGHVTDL